LDESNEQNLSNILAAIASVGPDANKDTLISTIDTSVDTIIGALGKHESGSTLDPEIAKSTTVTLQFLEQCSQLGDEEFKSHIKNRALELQQVFQGAASGEAPAAASAEATATHDSFEAAFRDYFCDFLEERLALFHVDDSQEPYPLNPKFTDVFIAAVRKFIVPDMLNHRRIRNMADSVSADQLHKRTFFEEFDKPDTENIVLLIWEDRIKEFRSALANSDVKGIPKPKKKKEEKGKGGLLGKFKKQESKQTVQSPAEKQNLQKSEGFWKAISKADGYDPPKFGDFDIFRVLMIYKPIIVNEAKNALRQFLEQEVKAGETREGATRDWLYKAVDRLPAHCGELVVLWSYMTFNDMFSPKIVRSFLAGQGTSDAERQRAVPLFMRWVGMPEIIEEEEEDLLQDENE